MLPLFPEFQRLDISHQDDIVKHYSKYLPYSDFNFVSMLSWDVNAEMQISEYNNSLVVEFRDYIDGKPFFSILGEDITDEMIVELLRYSQLKGYQPKLGLIPEHSITKINKNLFVIEEDYDNHDYIFNIEELVTMKGNKYGSRRGFINRFLRNYSNYELKKIDLSDISVQKEIIRLNNLWTSQKVEDGKDPKSENETAALLRLFRYQKKFNLVSYGLYIDNKLVGFTIDELSTNSDYVISHFIKADINIVGVYMFLLQKSVEHLYAIGYKLFNYEQDLGLPGLRKAKLSLRPINFLKKFKISLK